MNPDQFLAFRDFPVSTFKRDLWDMAGQAHLNDVEEDYKEKLEKEQKAREEATKVSQSFTVQMLVFCCNSQVDMDDVDIL